jgi:hypothetical protein
VASPWEQLGVTPTPFLPENEFQVAPGSWYSQHQGQYSWVDTGDRPGSNALGVPDSEQGIALPQRETLGQYYDVEFPNGQLRRLRHTDVGPAARTGRGIDIAAAAAEDAGYTPHNFPTDAPIRYRLSANQEAETPSSQPMAFAERAGESPWSQLFAQPGEAKPVATAAASPWAKLLQQPEEAAAPTPPETPEESGPIGRFAKGLAQGAVSTGAAIVSGFPTAAAQLRAGGIMGPGYDEEFQKALVGPEVAAAQEEQQRLGTEATRRAGMAIQKFGETQFPAEGFVADIGKGFGSVGANIALSLVNPAAGVLGAIAQGQGGQVQDAMEKGATPEQINLAAHLGTIGGATEFVDAMLPFLGTPAKLAGLIGKLGARVVEGAFIEGGQEGVQQLIQNAIAKGIYKPDQDISEGVGYNALIGAIVGGATTGALGKRETKAEVEAAKLAIPPADVSIGQIVAQPGEKVPGPVSPEAALDTVRPAEGQRYAEGALIRPPEGGEIRLEEGGVLPEVQPIFYSKLMQVAESKLPGSAGNLQILNTLRNNGVRQAEIDDTGLAAFLGDKTTHTKADIVGFLEENGIQVEEEFKTIAAYPGTNMTRADLQQSGVPFGFAVAPGPIQSYTLLRMSVPQKPGQITYPSPHFDPNTLGWLQITTRVDKAGQPVAHIEGMQSDWHQQGRALGYLTQNDVARLTAISQRQAAIRAEVKVNDDQIYHNTFNGMPERNAAIYARNRDLMNEHKALHLQAYEIKSQERAGQRLDKVPPAPFKSNWVELMTKRMFRWAADNGYSKISWASPELAMAWNSGRQGVIEGIGEDTRKFLDFLYGQKIPQMMKQTAKRYNGVLGATEVDMGPGRGLVRVEHVTVPETARTAIQQGMALYDIPVEGRGPAVTDVGYVEGPGLEQKVGKPFRDGTKKIVDAVNEFAKKFGLDTKISVRVVAQDSVRVGGKRLSGRGWAWKRPDGTYEIGVFANKFLGNLAAFHATMMHEFGHVVVWEKFDALPDATKQLIRLEFKTWRDVAKQNGTFENLLRTKRSAASYWLMGMTGEKVSGPLGSLNRRMISYHLSDDEGFHEYMADQVARWATTTAEPLSIVERAWQGIGKALRLFQEWMGTKFGVETRATQTVQNWLNSFLQAAPVSEQDYMRLDIRTQKANQYYVGLDSGDPNVSVPPAQAAIQPIKSQVDAGLGDAATTETKAAAAHADKINWLYEIFGSILDLAQRNPNFGPLLSYIAKARDKDRVEKQIHDYALSIAKSWRGLGRNMEEKLANFLDELTNMTYLTDEEMKRGVVRHPTPDEVRALVAKTGINDEALAVSVRVKQFMSTLLDNMADLNRKDAMKIVDPIKRAEALDRVNGIVANLKKKPYFPFMRFGRHFVMVKNPNGVTLYFETFERKGLQSAQRQQQRKYEEMKRLHPDDVVTMDMLPKTAEPFMGLPPNMLQLIRDKLSLTPSQLDALNQLEFQLAPSNSFRHHMQHKKYVPGYSRDFLRAFSRYAFHGGRYYAKTLYVDGLRQDIRDARAVGGNTAARIADFMSDHLENGILNVKGDYGTLKGLMFLWAMGFSPASATLNMTQTPMITFPFLASQFGDTKAAKVMARTMFKLSNFYKRGTYEGLQDWELRGLGYGIRTGRIVETQAPQLAGMAHGGIFRFSSGGDVAQRAANQIMEKSAWMFETAEQWNRRIVFRAAMRLAAENPNNKWIQDAVNRYPNELHELTTKYGHSEAEARAIVYAGHATDRTQFVYAGWARPKFMRGRLAGSIFIFKRYLQSLLFLAGSDSKFFWRYALIAAAMGGLGGIPGVEDVKNLVQAMLRWLGYNADVEKAIRTYIKDNLGDAVPGDVVLHGMARRGFGIPAALDALGGIYTGRPGRGLDMTKPGQNVPAPVFDRSRAVTAGPIIPEVVWQLMDPSKSVQESIGGAQTQALGYGFSAMANMIKAVQDNHLHWTDLKRWEKAEPRALASLSKMYRALTEADPDKPGFTRERSGQPLTGTTVTRYDLRDPEQLMEVIGVGLGYNDLRRANEWDRIIHQNEHAKYIEMQRKSILETFNEARKSSPQEFEAAKTRLREFNAGVAGTPDAGMAITEKTISQSVQARERERQARQRNIPVQKGKVGAAKEYERIYPRTIEYIER